MKLYQGKVWIKVRGTWLAYGSIVEAYAAGVELGRYAGTVPLVRREV